MLFLQIQFGQFGPQGIAALAAYRDQDDPAIAHFDVEIIRDSIDLVAPLVRIHFV